MPQKHIINQKIESFFNQYYPKRGRGVRTSFLSEEEAKQRDTDWNIIISELLNVNDPKTLNDICSCPLALSHSEYKKYAQSLVELLAYIPRKDNNLDTLTRLIENGLLIYDESIIKAIFRNLMPRSQMKELSRAEELQNLMGLLIYSQARSFNEFYELFKEVLSEKEFKYSEPHLLPFKVKLSEKQQEQNQLALKWLETVKTNMKLVVLAYEKDPTSFVHTDQFPLDMLGLILPLKSKKEKPSLTPHSNSYSDGKALFELLLLARYFDSGSLLHQDNLALGRFKEIMLRKLDETITGYANFLNSSVITKINNESIVKESMSYVEEIIDTMIFLDTIKAAPLNESCYRQLELVGSGKEKYLPYHLFNQANHDTKAAPCILDIVFGNTNIIISNTDKRIMINKLAEAGVKVSKKFGKDILNALSMWTIPSDEDIKVAIEGLDTLGLSIVDNMSFYESFLQDHEELKSDKPLLSWLKESIYLRQVKQKDSQLNDDLSLLRNVLKTGAFFFQNKSDSNTNGEVYRSKEFEDNLPINQSNHRRNHSF